MAELKRRRHGSVSTNTGGQLPGQHLLRPGVRATIRRPDYNKKPIPLVGHVVPPITATDDSGRKVKKHFQPYRDGHGMEGLLHWCVILDVAHGVGFGDDRKTFILCDPTDETANDVNDTPYGLLFRRISRAVKSAAGTQNRVLCGTKKISPLMWSDLLPNENTSYEAQAFIKPSRTRTGFVPMLLATDQGKLVLNPDTGRMLGATPGDIAQVVQLSGSAMETLRKQACEESAAFSPDNYDWESAYAHGDFTQLDGNGKFVTIYNPTHHSSAGFITMQNVVGKVSVDNDDDYDPSADGSRGSKRGGKGSFASYEIRFGAKVQLPRLDGQGDARYSEKVLFKNPAVAKDVLENYDEIYKYFYLPSLEEQALWVAQAYRTRPELLLYGWADNREYFTDEVNAVLSARVQGLVPSASQVEDPDDDDEPDAEDINSIYDDEDPDDTPPVISRKSDKPQAPKAMGKAGKATAAAMVYDDEDDDEPDDVMTEDDDVSPFGIGDDDDDDLEATISQADPDDELEDSSDEDAYGDDDESSMAMILAAAKAQEEARRAAAKAKAVKVPPTKLTRLKPAGPTLADLERRAIKAKADAVVAAGRKRKRRTDGLPQE